MKRCSHCRAKFAPRFANAQLCPTCTQQRDQVFELYEQFEDGMALLRAALADAEVENNELRSALADTKYELVDAEEDVSLLRGALNNTEDDLITLRFALAEANKQIAALRQSLLDAEEDASLLRDALADAEDEVLLLRDANAEEIIPPDVLKLLIRLCHPDKHGNSSAANRATTWLLRQRN